MKYYKSAICAVVCMAAAVFTACVDADSFDYGKEVLLITGTDEQPVLTLGFEEVPAVYSLTTTATGKVAKDITITYKIDNSLVDRYNAAHNTSYSAAPEGSVALSSEKAVIKAGSAVSESIDVILRNIDDFKIGPTYVIPVTISNIEGGSMSVLESSRTAFVKLSQTIEFNSLDMNNSNMYTNYIAADDLAADLSNFTMECKIYLNAYNGSSAGSISRICNFGPKDESVTNLLRLGESGVEFGKLQWMSPGGAVVSNTTFQVGRWYHLALTFDGSNYVMYVDGVKEAELAGTKGTTFQRFEFGMSWTSYTYSQRFNGRMAEIRIWNTALSAGAINGGLCGVDSQSEGLVAYWKLDEGEGHIFHDATGHGYDIDMSNTWREVSEGAGLVAQDKSAQVGWIIDDNNKCTN